jgi:hypothetical protein
MLKIEHWNRLLREAELKMSQDGIKACWNQIKDELAWDDLEAVTMQQLQLMDLAVRCVSAGSQLQDELAVLQRRRDRMLGCYARRFLQTVIGKNEKELVKRITRCLSDLLASAGREEREASSAGSV